MTETLAAKVVFVVPCHGRRLLAGVCMRQLRRTCDELAPALDATAVLVSDDESFELLALELGFGHVRQENQPLGRKWNDGFERALAMGADYVMPFGSDDVIDPALVRHRLPGDNELRCSRLTSVVSDDGSKLAELNITYHAGDGVRTFPAAILRKVGGRPAKDEKQRAIDGSITDKLLRAHIRPRIRYVDVHPLQIVDFKSKAGNLNGFDGCARDFGVRVSDDPWSELAAIYPAAFLDEMREVYGLARERMAA